MSVWLLSKYSPIDGSAMFTIVPSSTTIICAPAMTSRIEAGVGGASGAASGALVERGSMLCRASVTAGLRSRCSDGYRLVVSRLEYACVHYLRYSRASRLGNASVH